MAWKDIVDYIVQLVTVDDLNDLKHNVEYLHGEAGEIELADGILIPTTGGFRLGGSLTGFADLAISLDDRGGDLGAVAGGTALYSKSGRLYQRGSVFGVLPLAVEGTAAAFLGGTTLAGMRGLRQPNTDDRHVESGSVSLAGLLTFGNIAVSFTDAFASAPADIQITTNTRGCVGSYSSVSATGFVLGVDDLLNPGTSKTVVASWQAIGVD